MRSAILAVRVLTTLVLLTSVWCAAEQGSNLDTSCYNFTVPSDVIFIFDFSRISPGEVAEGVDVVKLFLRHIFYGGLPPHEVRFVFMAFSAETVTFNVSALYGYSDLYMNTTKTCEIIATGGILDQIISRDYFGKRHLFNGK